MRVLIISTTKFELDGITNVILNYYRSIDKSDMQIDFVIPNELKETLNKELYSCGSTVYKITGRIKNPIKYIKALSNLIKEQKYDIVHAHGNSYTLAVEMYAAKLGKCKIRIPHSHNTTSKHMLIHYALKRVFNKSYTHGFACGEKAGKWLYGEKDFEVINNGIDIDKYKFDNEIRKKYRKKYNIEEKIIIGHIGGFTDQKNHKFLINIFFELYKLNSNYRLMLIGDGNLRIDIETQIRELGLTDKVMLMGKTLDVPNLMQAMDIIIMPSKYEGLPLTLVEAQSACLPCFISTDITEEVKITNLIESIDLSEGPVKWAKLINAHKYSNRESIKDDICKKIVKKGYSIKVNAKKIKELYSNFINQN